MGTMSEYCFARINPPSEGDKIENCKKMLRSDNKTRFKSIYSLLICHQKLNNGIRFLSKTNEVIWCQNKCRLLVGDRHLHREFPKILSSAVG